MSLASSGTTIDVDIDSLYELQEAFKIAGKEAQKQAREVTDKVGRMMQMELKGAGMVGQGPLAAHVAGKITYERRNVFMGKDGVVRASKFTGGYLPVITLGVGGELPVSRKATEKNPKPTAAQVWGGVEFGSQTGFAKGGRRFRPRNRDGYWFFPTWKIIKDDSYRMWLQGMDEVLTQWGLKRPKGL